MGGVLIISKVHRMNLSSGLLLEPDIWLYNNLSGIVVVTGNIYTVFTSLITAFCSIIPGMHI